MNIYFTLLLLSLHSFNATEDNNNRLINEVFLSNNHTFHINRPCTPKHRQPLYSVHDENELNQANSNSSHCNSHQLKHDNDLPPSLKHTVTLPFTAHIPVILSSSHLHKSSPLKKDRTQAFKNNE